MPKLTYSTDGLNRLLAARDGRVYPLEGEFKVEQNTLTFDPYKEAGALEQLQLPEQLKFQGEWGLDANHDLRLVLTQSETQPGGGELKIHGKIMDVSGSALVFQTRCKKSPREDVLSLLHLSGCWQATPANQLRFLISRGEKRDVLQFSSRWQVNERHRVTYTYQKKDLIRQSSVEEELVFQGYWQISARDKLVYMMDIKNGSFFEFRAQMESPSLDGKEGEIRYRLGAGIKGTGGEQIISLFGRWKIGRQHSVFFEIDYGEKQIQAISFGAVVGMDKAGQFVFELQDKAGQPLGVSLTFQRDFFSGNAQALARVARIERALRVEAGIKIKW
ncbi:MAG: hypothetical protein V1662_05085 [Candidatus Omnitrophota bacterium]